MLGRHAFEVDHGDEPFPRLVEAVDLPSGDSAPIDAPRDRQLRAVRLQALVADKARPQEGLELLHLLEQLARRLGGHTVRCELRMEVERGAQARRLLAESRPTLTNDGGGLLVRPAPRVHLLDGLVVLALRIPCPPRKVLEGALLRVERLKQCTDERRHRSLDGCAPHGVGVGGLVEGEMHVARQRMKARQFRRIAPVRGGGGTVGRSIIGERRVAAAAQRDDARR